MRAGENPQGIFYLSKGFLRLYSTSMGGEELTLFIFKPGDIFPITWVFNQTMNNYHVEGISASELRQAPKAKFLDFIKENPDVFLELTKRMLVRLTGLLQRMEQLVFGNAYNKVASILLICAERFGRKEGKDLIVQVPLTHNSIASLVGISRETASIQINKLEKKGLLAHRGRLLVVKNARLLRRESLLESEKV